MCSYETLVRLFPEIEEYRVLYAQSLYKAGLYDQAAKACLQVESPQYAHRVRSLF